MMWFKGLSLHYSRKTPNAVISSHMTSRIRYQSAVFVAATRSQFQNGESNQRSKNRWQWWFVECNNWFSVVICSWSFPKIVVFLFIWGWSRHHSCFKIQLLNKRASFKNKCFAMLYGCSPNSLRISNLLSIWGGAAIGKHVRWAPESWVSAFPRTKNKFGAESWRFYAKWFVSKPLQMKKRVE